MSSKPAAPPPTAVIVARDALADAMKDTTELQPLSVVIDERSVEGALAICVEVESELRALDMTVPGSEVTATEGGSRAAKARTYMSKIEDAAKRPLNARREKILDLFKAVDQALASVVSLADGKVREWRRIELERQTKALELDHAHDAARQEDVLRVARKAEQEEQERLAAAAALETAGKIEEAAVALQEAVDVSPLHSAAQVAAAMLNIPAPPPAAAPEVRGVKIEGGGSATLADGLDFDVVDPWAIDRAFVKPPEPKRAEILKAIKSMFLLKVRLDADGLPIFPGVKVKRTEKTAFR
jgi:hypothetical protein